MFKKITILMRFAPFLGLVLVAVLGFAWATDYYSGSTVVQKGGESRSIKFISKGRDFVQVSIKGGSLDDYMTEQGVTSVEVRAAMTEEWVSTDDGKGYYKLTFQFGPSGAYFVPSLELKLKGKYARNTPEVWLYDENGERLEVKNRSQSKNMIIYKIDHFSRYFFDFYEY